jgi:drug/metabolite transporter (DMT)-like permease
VSLGVTLLVLFAAFMHAVWNAIVKASEDSLVQLATLNAATALIAAALLPVVGLPGWASLPYLAGNAACQSAYYVFLLSSYSAGGLSLVYPIARGSAPLLVALASAVFLGETLSGKHLLGVGLITASILSLAFSGGRTQVRPRAILFSLATGASIAAYTFIDGAGARAAESPFAYIVALFLINGVLLLPALWTRRRGVAVARMRSHWKTGALSGALSFGAYGIAVWAMTRAPIALVAALRETSVIVAALLGAVFLGEPFGRHRIPAALGVALGIAVLRLAG